MKKEIGRIANPKFWIRPHGPFSEEGLESVERRVHGKTLAL